MCGCLFLLLLVSGYAWICGDFVLLGCWSLGGGLSDAVLLFLLTQRFEGILGGKTDKAVALEEVLVLSSFMCKASQVRMIFALK